MAILFDCHSMPHDALNAAPVGLGPAAGRDPRRPLRRRLRALADRRGHRRSSPPQGFAVARNAPFAGGYITQTYGRPGQGVQALQIEIDRALYMDEARIERLPDFAEVAGAHRPAWPPASPRSARRSACRSRRSSRSVTAKKEAVHEARPKFREETPVGRV